MKEKICEFCGEPFVPNSNFQRYCKRPHYMNCPICGKQYLVTNNENLKRPPMACSYECRARKTRQTSLQKYGVAAPGNNPEARVKAKASMRKKYGVDYAMQSEELKEKAKDVLIQRYGVDNAMKSADVQAKAKQTNLLRYGNEHYFNSEVGRTQYKQVMHDKYGVEHPIQNEAIKNKMKATCIDRYGCPWFVQSTEGKDKIRESVRAKYGVSYVTQLQSVKDKTRKTFLRKYGFDNVSKNPKIKERIKATMIEKYGQVGVMSVPHIRKKIMKTSQERYGVPFYIMLDEVKKSSGAISSVNRKFAEKLNQLNVEYEQEHRIGTQCFDFYLPQYNLLVELNPTYTHNLIGNHWDKNGKPNNYHFQRCKTANGQELSIYCVFDWDAEEELLSRLQPNTELLESNQCIPYYLNRRLASKFLAQYGVNRMKQYPRKTIFFGLVYNKDVKQVIAIGLNKFASSPAYSIVDYGTKWGSRINCGLECLVSQAVQLMDIHKLCITLEFDRAVLDDLREVHVDKDSVKYYHPVTYWSKKDSRIPCKISKDDSEFLDSGWLPVEDCGYIQYSINIEKLVSSSSVHV